MKEPIIKQITVTYLDGGVRVQTERFSPIELIGISQHLKILAKKQIKKSLKTPQTP